MAHSQTDVHFRHSSRLESHAPRYAIKSTGIANFRFRGAQGLDEDGQKSGSRQETELVDGLRRGEDAAFESLVRTHASYLLNIARHILYDEALAEDCVQEAFLSAFRNIKSFEGRSPIRSWLKRIVINASLMKLRSKKSRREQSIETLLPNFDDHSCLIEEQWSYLATPEEIVERESTRALVIKKISELPETYRIVLILRDFQDLDTREVAEMLQISKEAARVRLHRARSALKKLLEPILRGEA